MAKHGKKKGAKRTKKIAKAKAGARTCHIKKSGRSFVLSCPDVNPIKLGIGFMHATFASKTVARAAKAAPSSGTVVANASGEATTIASGGYTANVPSAAEQKARLAAIKEAAGYGI